MENDATIIRRQLREDPDLLADPDFVASAGGCYHMNSIIAGMVRQERRHLLAIVADVWDEKAFLEGDDLQGKGHCYGMLDARGDWQPKLFEIEKKKVQHYLAGYMSTVSMHDRTPSPTSDFHIYRLPTFCRSMTRFGLLYEAINPVGRLDSRRFSTWLREADRRNMFLETA